MRDGNCVFSSRCGRIRAQRQPAVGQAAACSCQWFLCHAAGETDRANGGATPCRSDPERRNNSPPYRHILSTYLILTTLCWLSADPFRKSYTLLTHQGAAGWMLDDRSTVMHRLNTPAAIQIGERVQIKKGILEGVQAIVTGIAADRRCLLVVDGWPNGALISADLSVIGRTVETAQAAG
jgi:hypothetical protein